MFEMLHVKLSLKFSMLLLFWGRPVKSLKIWTRPVRFRTLMLSPLWMLYPSNQHYTSHWSWIELKLSSRRNAAICLDQWRVPWWTWVLRTLRQMVGCFFDLSTASAQGVNVLLDDRLVSSWEVMSSQWKTLIMDYARRPFRDIYFSTKGVRNTLFCEHIRTFICNNSKMTFYLP